LKRLLECVGRLEPDRQKSWCWLAYYNGWSREQLAAKFRKRRVKYGEDLAAPPA